MVWPCRQKEHPEQRVFSFFCEIVQAALIQLGHLESTVAEIQSSTRRGADFPGEPLFAEPAAAFTARGPRRLRPTALRFSGSQLLFARE
jgi:hypothetical protein